MLALVIYKLFKKKEKGNNMLETDYEILTGNPKVVEFQ